MGRGTGSQTDVPDIFHTLGGGEVILLTSAGVKTQLFPNFLAWASPPELGRSRSTAVAPCPTSRSAVARPKPEAPPVITATRSCEEGTVNSYVVQALSFTLSPGFC